MTESRLSHVAILNIHPHEANNLNIDESVDEFICKNSKRTSVFHCQIINKFVKILYGEGGGGGCKFNSL